MLAAAESTSKIPAARVSVADPGDRDSGDAARHACGGPGGEEKLIVFAAVERQVESPIGGGFLRQWMDR